jgi:hypothetical protein
MIEALLIKLSLVAFIYIVLLIYHIFANYVDTSVNDSNYVPKSKQNKIWDWTRPMTTWLQRQASLMEDKIMAWNTMGKRRQKLRRATNIARNMQTPTRRYTTAALFCFAAVAMQANGSFDTDSEPIGVDNRCTGCISNYIEDFVGPLEDSKRSIKGFGGSRTSNVKISTICWKWLDNDGKQHKFQIPKSFYVASGNVCLLSPQHWVQTQKSKDTIKYGTGSETVNDKVKLFWKDRHNRLSIPLGRNNNVATFGTAPGYRKSKAFCTTAELNYEEEQVDPIIATPAEIVSNDDKNEAKSENEPLD